MQLILRFNRLLIIIKNTQAVIKDHTFRSSNHKIQNAVTVTVHNHQCTGTYNHTSVKAVGAGPI